MWQEATLANNRQTNSTCILILCHHHMFNKWQADDIGQWLFALKNILANGVCMFFFSSFNSMLYSFYWFVSHTNSHIHTCRRTTTQLQWFFAIWFFGFRGFYLVSIVLFILISAFEVWRIFYAYLLYMRMSY